MPPHCPAIDRVSACPPSRSRIGDLVPALGLALAMSVLLLYLSFRPGPAGSAIAAIYPPGTSASAAFAAVIAAGGTPIRGGAFDNIMIARADDDGLPSRLRQHGAWLAVDAVALAACLHQ